MLNFPPVLISIWVLFTPWLLYVGFHSRFPSKNWTIGLWARDCFRAQSHAPCTEAVGKRDPCESAGRTGCWQAHPVSLESAAGGGLYWSRRHDLMPRNINRPSKNRYVNSNARRNTLALRRQKFRARNGAQRCRWRRLFQTFREIYM